MVTKIKPKRSKTMPFFLLPLFAFIFAAEWTINLIDGNKPDKKVQKRFSRA
jgi:hypothetical protein